IMHFRLWGRAEGVRAALRYLAQAIAPIAFAGLYILFSGSGSLFGIAAGQVQQSEGALAYTFAVMLIAIAAAGGVLFIAMRTYPRDVATARASEQAIADDRGRSG